MRSRYDTEPNFDYVFVEARTVGAEDWTTLPDANGATSQDTGAGCIDPNPFWLNENPFLRHYITRTEGTPVTCAPTGTSGAWNAAIGNSGGFHPWHVDLGAYAGKQVEFSITYVTDPASLGLGVFVDDTKVTTGATTAETSFEADLGGWTVPGAPADSGANVKTGSAASRSDTSTDRACPPTTPSTSASASRGWPAPPIALSSSRTR